MKHAQSCRVFSIIRMAPYTSRNPSQKRKKGKPARPSPSSPNPTSKFQVLFRADFPAKALARQGTEPAALTEPTDRSRRTEPTDLTRIRASLKVSNHIAARHVNISHPVRSGSCPRPRSRNCITPHKNSFETKQRSKTGADPIHHIVIHPSSS